LRVAGHFVHLPRHRRQGQKRAHAVAVEVHKLGLDLLRAVRTAIIHDLGETAGLVDLAAGMGVGEREGAAIFGIAERLVLTCHLEHLATDLHIACDAGFVLAQDLDIHVTFDAGGQGKGGGQGQEQGAHGGASGTGGFWQR
jgi:hypothetical protein